MRINKVAAVFLLVMSTLSGVALTPTPASAELGELQETFWGLATKGNSRTLEGWRQDPLGWAVEQAGGAMYVGGQFLDITNGQQTIRQPYLAAFDAGDGTPLPWIDTQIGGPVLALEYLPDGGLMVGGEVESVDGVNLGALAKIDPTTGELWPGWQTRVFGGSSVVRDIRLEADGWLYVVGGFDTATEGNGPIPVGGAIRMNPNTGAIDTNWVPQVDGGSVWGVGISVNSNRVYLAGWFTSVNGDVGARGFAGLDNVNAAVLDDRATIPYNTCVQGCQNNYRLYDVIATEFDEVWAVGEQHAMFILEEDNNLNMRMNHVTGCNPVLQNNDCTRRGGEFQELERSGDRIYATCHCWGWHHTDTETIFFGEGPTLSGTPTGAISTLAAYDPNSGQRIAAVDPYMAGTAGGFAIAAASDGCVWITGGITQVGQPGNQRQARDLARLCDENGPGPDPQPNPVDPGAPSDAPPPPSCLAENSGTAATISWEPSPGANDYRVFRSIDGGNAFWRGVTSDLSFTDTLRNSGVHDYTVQARGATGVWSASTPCAPSLDPQAGGPTSALPPATCAATNDGTSATITWAASDGATDYRVFRSVNGGSAFWRGLSQTTSFTDTLRNSGTHDYTVQARGADGVWSASTPCNPTLDPQAGGPQPVGAPASCDASAVGTAATITWPAVANATDYRVFRSVDGGNDFWRGLTQTTTFEDTLRAGRNHTYSVQARGADGVWSASTPCNPVL